MRSYTGSVDDRLYNFRPAFSGFEHAHVAAARVLWRSRKACRALGDRSNTAATGLSAAFCNLDREAQEDLTRRYEELCAHSA